MDIDLGAATSMMGLVKSASDIITGAMSNTDEVKRNAALIEVQMKLVAALKSATDAHHAINATMDAHKALEREIMDLKSFKAEAENYLFKMPFPGVFVYARKCADGDATLPHYLCANCFEQGKKSHLHTAADRAGWTLLKCPNCVAVQQTTTQGPVIPTPA